MRKKPRCLLIYLQMELLSWKFHLTPIAGKVANSNHILCEGFSSSFF